MGQEETKDNNVRKIVDKLDPNKVQCKECDKFIDKSEAKIITITERGRVESNAVCVPCFDKNNVGIHDYFNSVRIQNADVITINGFHIKNRFGPNTYPKATIGKVK